MKKKENDVMFPFVTRRINSRKIKMKKAWKQKYQTFICRQAKRNWNVSMINKRGAATQITGKEKKH